MALAWDHEGLIMLIDMIGLFQILKVWSLLQTDFFLDVAILQCTLDIHLLQGELVVASEGKEHPVGLKPSHGTKMLLFSRSPPLQYILVQLLFFCSWLCFHVHLICSWRSILCQWWDDLEEVEHGSKFHSNLLGWALRVWQASNSHPFQFY